VGCQYFAIEIEPADNAPDEDAAEPKAALPVVCLGLCAEFVDLTDIYVGWRGPSIAFHGDDGLTLETWADGGLNRVISLDGCTFAQGNKVGCGIDWDKEVYYFTLEGKRVGECLMPGRILLMDA
jgi:hypothetical protein